MKYSSRLKKVFNRIEHMRKKATLSTALLYATVSFILGLITGMIAAFFYIIH